MQNCYAVVRVDRRGHDHLSAIYMTRTQAEEDVAAITAHPLIEWQAGVVEVSLVPLHSPQGQSRITELEHDVRTLQTMVTALNGRVAELSKTQAAK